MLICIFGFQFCGFAVDVFKYEDLRKALEQLSNFEKRANGRVIESGVLKGIILEDIKRAGERLILQDGCTTFFQNIVKNVNLNANVHVLSYCWCGDLIRSAFSSGMSLPIRMVECDILSLFIDSSLGLKLYALTYQNGGM